MTEAPDDTLTVREVAALLGRSTNNVRELLYANTLPSEVDERSGNYRVRRADVEAFQAGTLHADPHPMFAALGEYADQIAAAQRHLDELVEARNRELVGWVDERGQSVTAAAKAAHLSRDRTTTILRVTRAEQAARAARSVQQ